MIPGPDRMTCRERFLAALARKPVDRAPGWMMRQAGRYLPEYHEASAGRPFMERVRDPVLSEELTMQPIRRFGMDAAVVFSDILVPPAAMGVDVRFVEGKGPVLAPVVRDREGVARLRDFDPERDTGYLAETLRRVRAALGDTRALIGFCGAPFTTASYLVEGGPSKGFERTKAMLYGDPSLFDALQTRLVDALAPYLAMQVRAGADALQIFDSWAGSLDADTYRRACLPHLARLVAAARESGEPVIVYANGADHLLELFVEAGPDAVSLDWRTPPEAAIRRTTGRVALQGNLDPALLFAGPDVTRRAVARLKERFAGAPGWVFNVGSGLTPGTPPESVAAAFDELRASG
jgi:uroporphyrinogen decarboxylase